MNLRVVQWNIRINSNASAVAKRLQESVRLPTIVHLQEVSSASFRTLCELLNPSACAFSLDHRAPGQNEGQNRNMGVATLSFGGRLLSSQLVDRSVFPERTLVTEIEFTDARIVCLNFHSLTGVDYKKAKSSNFASIADFMQTETLDFLACDANEPKVDSLLGNEVKFFDNRDKGRCAAMIFGENSGHNLIDSYKSYLRKSGVGSDTSPLATSHVVGGRHCRYDHIYHALRWDVTTMTYDYESARKATSDHAIVVADFSRDG